MARYRIENPSGPQFRERAGRGGALAVIEPPETRVAGEELGPDFGDRLRDLNARLRSWLDRNPQFKPPLPLGTMAGLGLAGLNVAMQNDPNATSTENLAAGLAAATPAALALAGTGIRGKPLGPWGTAGVALGSVLAPLAARGVVQAVEGPAARERNAVNRATQDQARNQAFLQRTMDQVALERAAKEANLMLTAQTAAMPLNALNAALSGYQTNTAMAQQAAAHQNLATIQALAQILTPRGV
jgi:hypothetical protein